MSDGFIDERFRTVPEWDSKGWCTWTTFCKDCDVSASFQYSPDQEQMTYNVQWMSKHERMVHKSIKKLKQVEGGFL